MSSMSHEEAYQPLDIKDLELKLDQLIELYQSVKSENDTLKVKQEVLIREKAQLLEKTTLAKNRVEAMISRLKVMGQGS